MKDINITDTFGAVDLSSVKVSKKGFEQVTWHSNVSQDTTIKFDADSPFQQSEFTVPAGKSVSSGPPVVPASSTTYKYTVYGHDGQNDPVVIVDN